jgi:hypothetical protein
VRSGVLTFLTGTKGDRHDYLESEKWDRHIYFCRIYLHGSIVHALGATFGIAHVVQGVAQFSIFKLGMADISLSMVTTVQSPMVIAMAAIMMSFWPIGRPAVFSAKAMRPYSNAAFVSGSQSFQTSSARCNERRFRCRCGLPSARNANSASTGPAMPTRFPFAVSA